MTNSPNTINRLAWSAHEVSYDLQEFIATTVVEFDRSAPVRPKTPMAVSYRIIKNATATGYILSIGSVLMEYEIGEYSTLEEVYAAAQAYHNRYTLNPNQHSDFSKYPVLLIKALGLDLNVLGRHLATRH